MKKKLIIMFNLLTMYFTGFSQSIIVSGNVLDITNNFAIPNHLVNIYIDDSVYSSYNYDKWIYTDINGFYSDTIDCPLSQGVLTVRTYDCNQIMHETLISFDPQNINYNVDFSICEGSYSLCNAGFVYSPDTVDNFTIQFVANSSININSWYWDFGDGYSSTEQNPNHTFYQNGSYLVCLYAFQDSSGVIICSDTICNMVDVGSQNCSASFISYQESCNTCVTFNSNSVSTGNIDSWFWDFGDGTTGNTQSVYHCYQSPGTYSVNLTIYTDNGCSSVFTANIDILPAVPIDADFSIANDTIENLPNIFFFTPDYNTATYWSWDFGDGTNSNLQNPYHIFPDSGTYNVCLTIMNGNCIDTKCKTVIVGHVNKFLLGGQVFGEGYVPLSDGYAYLYSVYNKQISFVKSMYFDLYGYYYFYNINEGKYIVKIVAGQNNPVTSQYVPTYYGDAVFWNNASIINLNDSIFDKDLYMKTSIPSNGPGTVYGNLNFNGNNKSNIEILLLDMNNNVVSFTYTDLNGFFQFDALAYGTYILNADEAGKNTIPDTITIDSDNLTCFVQLLMSDSMIIYSVISNDDNSAPVLIGNIFPNPVMEDVNFEIEIVSSASFIFEIFNSMGQKINENKFSLDSGKHLIKLSAEGFSKGIYFLHIFSSDRKYNEIRKFIK